MRWGVRLFLAAASLAFSLPASLAAHGDLHDQIAAVTKQIEREPGNASLYLKRGELHRLHGAASAALDDCGRARGLDPALAEAELCRGKAFAEAGRPKSARLALDRFLKKRPDDAEGRLALARVLVALGLADAADAEYAQALALLPAAKPDVYFERVAALACAGRIDRAVAALDEGIARLGPLAALEERAIDLELQRKSYDAALARLDRIAPVFRRRETWLARRGRVLAAAGRTTQAREALRAALDAIETLPARLRQTRAMRRLDRSVRESLDGLKNGSRFGETSDAES